MDPFWVEIIVKTPVGVVEMAEAALHMVTPLGLYIEDYSDLDATLNSIKNIDLIETELMLKDRETALLHVYFPPEQNLAECIAAVKEYLKRAGFTEITADASLDGAAEAAAATAGAEAAPTPTATTTATASAEAAPTPTATAGAIFSIISNGKIAEEDWANNWKQYFKPLRVGKSILIVPEWESIDYSATQLTDGVTTVVSIDPGMAFGTGGHATTRLCLELMEKYFVYAQAPPDVPDALDTPDVPDVLTPPDVLDVGCGSGILAIAAVLIGARSALGVDIDAYAVRNAQANAALNGVADKIKFQTGDLLRGIDGSFGLITANIVADAVIMLMRDVGRHLLPGGALILSGIIDDREDDVIKAAAVYGFSIIEIRRAEGWTALLCGMCK